MSDKPVVMNHADAATPQSEWAKQLAAEAAATAGQDKKQGGIKDLATGRQDMFRLNPYSLTLKPGWNSRNPDDPDNQAHIDWLAKSIASEGLKVPLMVFWEDGHPVVEDGHCRLLAVLRAIEVYGAEIKSIPVQVTDRRRSEADRVLSQIVANSGKALTPYEMGEVCSRLRRLGWTIDEIAKRTARSARYIEDLLQLQAAPAEVKQPVATGKVSATLAIKALTHHNGDGQAAGKAITKAVEAAEASGASKATERHMRATGGAKPKTPPPSKPATPAAPKPQAVTPVSVAPVIKPSPIVTKTAPSKGGLTAEELVTARQILERAKWNDTPPIGRPVTCAMDADEYAQLRDIIGF